MSGPAVTRADGAMLAGRFDSIGTWNGWLRGTLSEGPTARGERWQAIDFSILLASGRELSE